MEANSKKIKMKMAKIKIKRLTEMIRPTPYLHPNPKIKKTINRMILLKNSSNLQMVKKKKMEIKMSRWKIK